MRKTLLFALLIVIVGYTSCKDEVATPVVTPEPTTAKAGAVVYTVNVVSGGNAINGRSAGLDQAKVTVAQQGTVTTMTTGTSGQAAFPLMGTGIITVTVEATDHTTVHYIVDLNDPLDMDSIGSQSTRYGSTLVILYALTGSSMSTVIGKVTANFDSVLTPRNPAVDKKISYVIKSGGPTQTTGVGKITFWAIENVVNSVKTGSDGRYSLQVPGTGDGLDITLFADDFVADKQVTIKPIPSVKSTDYTAAPVPIKSVSGTTKIVNIAYVP